MAITRSGTGTAFANQAVTLNPATDANRAAMIRSSIWSTSAAVRLHSVPNGSYTVYLYTWEDNDLRSFKSRLEGTDVESAAGNLPLGGWKKYGPYPVAVSDGALNVDLVRVNGDVHLMGMAVFK
ncbi:hypothetical protein JQX13_31285 [Archangium violaceum]|uniref:hypothetical protein n=1 Tax=Archangium violaceum TaxID=83451 RepID=UPI00193C6F1C|nr:hypothetical protein [Archangium violaceum]QRK04706.1 hypothetical protein JQX13_31285 [Archangium violaceum]